jgi:transcriptional regulator with PAS, ATPase and Fis domain
MRRMSRDRGEAATTLTTIHRRSARVPSLLVVATQANGVEITHPLGLAPVTVGTSPECALTVEDGAVSRQHCALSVTTKGVVVRDLDSKNGTFIGGVEIDQGYLPASSFARIGSVTLRLRVMGEPTEVALWPAARFGDALGGSIVMRALFALLHQAAQTPETILLTGESGTGKELLARAIHDESPRKDAPFVVFDAGAVAPALLESELFGHVPGAFTGASAARAGLLAQAHGGTLMMDEIGELPLDLQPKLLRALESRQFRPVGGNAWQAFDARVIAATHRDLRAGVANGTFRQDLFFRLAVIQARVPALRERRDDIELLVERFLAAQIPPRTVFDLAPGALAMLIRHDWPGNVRELKNTVARLALFPELGQAALDPGGVEGQVLGQFDALLGLSWRDARERMTDRFEALYVAAKLREHEGNVAKAAAQMGVSKQLVYRLMVRHGLAAKEEER